MTLIDQGPSLLRVPRIREVPSRHTKTGSGRVRRLLSQKVENQSAADSVGPATDVRRPYRLSGILSPENQFGALMR